LLLHDERRGLETMTATRSLLARLPELALEALMVVFAVLVALAVEEWRDERQMHEFADRARMGVVTELRANLDEFEETGPGLLATDAMLREVTQEEDFSLLANFNLGLPDFSSAAWRASQASPAASYFDFDWVIEVPRAYETYEVYSRMADQVIDEVSSPSTTGVDRVRAILGRLATLTGGQVQVQERLEDAVSEQGERGEAAPSGSRATSTAWPRATPSRPGTPSSTGRRARRMRSRRYGRPSP
jgi:hypothetical protein